MSARPTRRFRAVVLLVVQALLLLAFASRAAMSPSLDTRSNVRPRDLVEMGQLLVDSGVWQARRLNPQEWVKQLMTSGSGGGAFPVGKPLPDWRRRLLGDALLCLIGEPDPGMPY